ncbi:MULTISPECIES: alpha/beta fold hydrolase [Acinetobacter calcoaceticus/baumannii complex]|jgi:pimeloyl-ACP methyl ester carboxylesterase|uniref:Alpha/beta hydrolase n=1 Tax=Acinetobacter pittii TaxID=48296 RepID=A0AAE9S8H9_ACIPI|nr:MULTISPECIES: alpha/beta hydrolase [Acinetobacter calcoaceticus/baumannii complex]EXE27701.1 alpha/beta hydrolase fold family protein [Acinetobacter sp. 907131]EXS18016.1 alpha/beta hydrolase fold family protein [Acinetobacter sp. 883425]KRI81480.1 hydrolase [Acinetobacter pittii]KRJ66708.1 hydrolase [Acinetobacter pittii]MBK0410987.1 alpha/beta hydrolase [Acinetobacter pittii]
MNSIIQMDSEINQAYAGFGFFDIYHRDSFKQPARTTWIDGWKIEYMAIADPKTIHKTPIVIVGGAFQNFNSYKYCVEQLFESGPVILIDLPSMGANQQITNRDTGVSAGTLELPDLSEMLGRWLDIVGIQKVSVMGMSLGSVIASCFAHQRPDLMDRMILMGVMQKTRKSWRMILEESLKLMQENRMEEFGQAVILYLVNHAKLDKTRMSPTAKKLFFRQMAEFTGTERERYEINCNRLLRLTDVPIPECKTLVAAGQYDSFTLPHENANFALQCPDMEFALIANADHVPQLQRRKETMSLFTSFLKGESIQNLDGIIPMTRDQMQKMERRGEERVPVLQPNTQLSHRECKTEVPVTIVDVTFFGIYLKMDDISQLDFVNDHPRDLALHLEDEEGPFSIECLIFEATEQGIRALFKHGSFELADRLSRFIARQKLAV